MRTCFEYADFVRLPRADSQLAFGDVHDLVSSVGVHSRSLTGIDLENPDSEMLRARVESDQHTQVASPNDVSAVKTP